MTLGVTARGRTVDGSRLGTALRRILRGRESDPAWSRPALLGVVLLAAILTVTGLTVSRYANTYYASAVYAGSHSWSAFFNNALDLSQYVAIDKTPLAVWMMSLSARAFGFSSFSMLLPNALCGVAEIVLLHDAVRRTMGHRAAAAAALMLALTPVWVMVSRFNNPDALLVLLLVCAAWATVRAIESGRTRHLLLAGVLVGLAFNTKMLQAYLVLPALAITYLHAGPGRVRRRFAQLAAAGAAMLAVSAAWVVTMSLIPAAQRPYVGDTTHNSWFELIFSANGLDRVGSDGLGGPGGGFGGARGALRMFNVEVGGQAAWLLPLAIVGLAMGLWVHRRAGRGDRGRAAYVLWGIWAVVHFAIFSFALTLFHPYYTSALAPAIAALAGGGVILLWDRARASRLAATVLAASLLGSGALAVLLLGRTPSFLPWLRWVAPAAAILAAAGLLVARGRVRALIPVLAAAAILAGPAAYSVATVGRSLGGGNPTAGPPGEGPGRGGFARGVPPPGLPPPAFQRGVGFQPPAGLQPPPGAPGGPPGAMAGNEGKPDDQLIVYLRAHRGSTRYLVAANGSMTAAPIILATHARVITMGGFGGQDPAPTVAQLRSLIASGQLRFVLVLVRGRGGPPHAAGLLSGAGRRDGPPRGGAPFARGGGSRVRDAWVARSCKAVSGHAGLYDCEPLRSARLHAADHLTGAGSSERLAARAGRPRGVP
ncbi:MAG: glycosyltransferase family 39 protein [Thermoleophilaceae bacterium]